MDSVQISIRLCPVELKTSYPAEDCRAVAAAR